MSDYPTQSTFDDMPLFADLEPPPARKVKASRSVPNAKTLFRPTHRETSEMAAERLIESGTLAGDSADALELVLNNPGRTAYELESIDKMPSGKGYGRPDRIRKRLAGLADSINPKIERGPVRVCFEKGTKCQTWWPIGRAPKPEPKRGGEDVHSNRA